MSDTMTHKSSTGLHAACEKSQFALVLANMSSVSKQFFARAAFAAAGIAASFTSQTSAQDQLWVRQFGTIEYEEAWALAPDGEGGMFVAGLTGGALGGPNTGASDAFLARYDSAGNQLWITQFGSTRRDEAVALEPDGAGGVFVSGRTEGDLAAQSAGRWDIWIARYDAAGNRRWIRQFGTIENDEATDLAPDGAGGVIITGYTFGNLGGPNAGGWDMFLASYDSAGNRGWTRQFGTNLDENATALSPDGAGGVMVAGWTHDQGVAEVFLARHDNSGNRLWIRIFGTSSHDHALALAPDGAGGVMVLGITLGSLGGPSAGGRDVFLARYDGDGDQLWIRQFGTSDADFGYALAPDGAGGVIATGYTGGDLGGPNAGGRDVFLTRYDNDGNRLWLFLFGSSNHDAGYAVAADGEGGVMVAGSTQGDMSGPNAGQQDVFLARFEIDSCDPCDMNCDAQVNAFDIEPFLDLLFDPNAKPCNTCTGDVNADGNINAFDIEPFLECLFP